MRTCQKPTCQPRMRKLRFCHSQSIAVALLLVAGTVFANRSSAQVKQQTAEGNSPGRPLQGTIIGSIHAGRLKEGSTFRVRVAANWEDEHCRLRPGEIVQGHVSGVVKATKAENSSQFQLAFTAPTCADPGSQPMALTLIALVGSSSPNETDDTRLSQAPPLADSPSVEKVKDIFSSQQGSVPFGQSPKYSSNGKRAAAGSAPVASPARDRPTSITIGQVVNAPKISLEVGSANAPSTVVASARGDARIESGSMLVLVASDRLPSRENVAVASASSKATGSEDSVVLDHTGPRGRPVPPPPNEPAIENEVCSTSCVTLSELEARKTEGTKSLASIPLKALGYAPHQRGWARAFNHETTLTFLDEHRLLCTFDPHQLRARNGDSPEPLRDIKAVLIDPGSFEVQQVLEWRVRGDDTYLWRFGRDKVLVHMGNTLQLLDRNLKVLRTVPVEGAVAWVVSSPSNDHTAVGFAKERRVGGAVDQKQNAPGQELNADVLVKVFDAGLNLISESSRTADLYPPVLSDAGELRLEHAGSGKWELIEYSWARKERSLVTVHSVCRPLFSAQENGLTFVTGCAALNGNIWYRMLDAKGHTLLKTESFSDELAHRADAAASGSFAIRVVRASRQIPAREPFRRSDLLQERIDVFRDSDGKRVDSVATDDFVLAENSFALSPVGDEMAIVGKEAILFYKIGKDHE